MRSIKIIYWISTVLAALGLIMAAAQYLSDNPQMQAGMAHLGYPHYLLYILGTAKLIGATVLLVPGFPKLKEWGYAGVTIAYIGALWSHWATDGAGTIAAPFISLLILAVSYITYTRLQKNKRLIISPL